MSRTATSAVNGADYAVEMENQTETEIDLVALLYHLLRHIKLLLLVSIVMAVGAGLYTQFVIKPTYQASAKLYVLNSSDSALNLADLQIGSYLARDFKEVFKTWEVHETVIQNLNLPYSYDEMQSMLTVENPTDTRILYITVQTHDPAQAAAIANEYAAVAIRFIANTMSTDEPNMMSQALVPTKPSSPSLTRNTMLAFVLGLAIVIGVLTVQFVLDDKIKSIDDIRKYVNMPVLAVVPTMPDANDENARRGGGRKKR